jgi:hypothetical protein
MLADYNKDYRSWERKHYAALKELFTAHLSQIAPLLSPAEIAKIDEVEEAKPKRSEYHAR